jgi:hypothetical protein
MSASRPAVISGYLLRRKREGWYANQDWSHFIRKEENDGRVEWVMLDVEGPGCIVRFWMGGNAPYGKLRFYLDGSRKPVIEETADALLGHGALVGRPLSAVRSRGLNFFFPIPYAKGCKITYELTGGKTEIQHNLREGWSNNRQL